VPVLGGSEDVGACRMPDPDGHCLSLEMIAPGAAVGNPEKGMAPWLRR